MNMMRLVFILAILSICSRSFSQNSGENSVVGCFSTTFISRTGDYEIGKQYDAALGYFGGYQRHFSISDYKFTGEAILAYSRIKYHNDETLVDEAGFTLGSLELTDRSLNLVLGILYNHEFNKLKLGIGLQLKGNIFNETIGKSSLVTVKEGGMSNRRLDISIPAEVSYPLGNLDILLRYERGLISRLNSSQKDIKEFDNTVRLGARVFLDFKK